MLEGSAIVPAQQGGRVVHRGTSDGSSPSAERAQIEAAIAALEAQRSLLGDAVVDTALGPLREKLEADNAEPLIRRRQCTVMFADLSGFTTLSEGLDPEEITSMLSGFWEIVDAIITSHRGNVLQHMADGVIAVWGDTQSQEDDAYQSVRAALAIIESIGIEGIQVADERREAAVSIGINTGPVHLGDLDASGYTILGDTANVAARLEGKAGRGETYISRSTYHDVRGLFDLDDVGAQELKGRTEPVNAYRVVRERPDVLRSQDRGLEGSENDIVGRDAETSVLETAFVRTVDAGESGMVTLIGEPGIGKSRLISLVRTWIDDHPTVSVLEGRALPGTADVPLALLRNILTHRFAISDDDDQEAVRAKLGAGFARTLGGKGSAVARSVGWLVGLLPGQSGLGRDDAQFRRNNAVADLRDFFETVSSAEHPAVLILEDVHWADNDSIEIIESFAADPPDGLFIVASTRPDVLGSHPKWGDAGAFGPTHHAIQLEPLTASDTDALLAGMLSEMETIPEALRERVLAQCDGNPYHVEELVKMLIDDRVIDRSESVWRFDEDRLSKTKVPTTLTGVLQARLDHLPRNQFATIQAGSVFGRFFWESAVLALVSPDGDIAAELRALIDSALLLPRSSSRFALTDEVAFKHDFTRVVTYDTIDLKDRPQLHALAARWLEHEAGDRADEFAVAIAQHHEAAGANDVAANWFARAARQAQGQSAYGDAARLFAIAGDLAEVDSTERLQLTIDQSYALVVAGKFDEARAVLNPLMETAERTGKTTHWMLACTELARIALFRDGDFALARDLLGRGLARGEAAGLEEETLLVRHQLGNVAIIDGEWDEAIRLHTENVAQANTDGELYRRGWGLNSLAHAHAHAGNYEEALDLADQTLKAAEELSDPRLLMAAQAQKGLVALHQERWFVAVEYFEAAQELNRRNGDPEKLATVANYLGEAALGAGDFDRAFVDFDEARAVGVRAGVRTELVRAVVGLAELAAHRGLHDLSIEALHIAENSNAAASEARRMISTARERSGQTTEFTGSARDLDEIAAFLRTQLAPNQ
jgi:class 3 adenylate cyclase/tetratricopeptide (TPR) repeat protein